MQNRKYILSWTIAVMVAVFGFVLSHQLIAQGDPKPSEVTTNAPAAPEKIKALEDQTLWDLFVVGGLLMWPILALSIVGVALVVRNSVIYQDKKLLRPDLIPALQQHMAMREVFQVQQLCTANPCLLTAVLSAGLERVTTNEIDLETIEQAIEEGSAEQMTGYMVPISFLSVIGVIAPMLGLLGTVSGMIGAFYKLAAGGMGRPEMLANNIGEAMITTYAGLVVAIPSMLAYFFFKNNFIRTMARLGRITGTLVEILRSGQLPMAYGQNKPNES
jgi:biopolymer transport protein ExbB